MLKKSFFGLFIVFAFASGALAQSAHTPAKNSAERTEILNALRVPVEKKLKQKISFSVSHFKVGRNWAFLSGEPQNARGGRPDYRKTPYRDAVDSGAFDNNIFALLKKTGGKWTVVTYAIGCTDVCYLEWQTDHKAPKAIFPGAGE
jgi:hypothetical protein